ncbi:MAG TPA: hypothetical protein VN739_02465 [Nitrososphaerales archaeon]|nr:hypothetical protein [Nitrososphaerales archaeon]
MNDQGAQSCGYCGYLFENFSTPVLSASDNEKPIQPSPLNTIAPPSDQEFSTTYPSSSVSSASPLFVVSRSLLASILPGITYLLFIVVISSISSVSVFSLLLIVLLIAVSVIPILFSPRRYEFFDNSLRIHKIIGGDSEFQYSDLTMYDSPTRRRAQLVLSAVGQKRPIVIQGNPMNKELGMDLKQFLSSRLKKPESTQKAKEQGASEEDTTTNSDTPA